MIPENVARFISEGPLFGVLGTTNARNQPSGHRVWGWRVDDDATMTLLVPERFAMGLATAVQSKGRCSFTVTHGATFETYQLKGRLTESHPVDDGDLSVFERFAAALLAVMRDAYGLPSDKASAYMTRPDVAVSFAVDEVFNQTPGPQAGTRLAGGT